MNQRTLFALLVLLGLSLSCGQTGTPIPMLSTDTPYVPPTAIANVSTSTALTDDIQPTVIPSEYVPPTITPTQYVPPAVTPSVTEFVPSAAKPTSTQPPTEFVPPIPPPQNPVKTQIIQKYIALGGEAGFLGAATVPEQSTPDGIGRFRHFQGGSIYWTAKTGAWEVHGDIRNKWASFGWEQGFLGYPLTDESITPDGIGRYNHFQGGSIYWTPNTGAWEVHGDIRIKWASMGWENSCLGYPISDEEPGSGGWARQSRFEHGIIKWSPEKGAVEACY